MQYSLIVHGEGERVTHVHATSAEDAMRQVQNSSSGEPFRATFLPVDDGPHEAERTVHVPAIRRRAGSEDIGHTRTHAARRVRR